MRKIGYWLLILVLLFSLIPMAYADSDSGITVTEYPGAMDISMTAIGHYDSGSGEGGTEIAAYAPLSKKIFVVNGAEKALDIVSLSDIASDKVTTFTSNQRIKMTDLQGVTTARDITSVDVAENESFVAVAVAADPKTDNGHVVLMDMTGKHIATYEVGPLPDMVKITKDAKRILVANEGEPNDDFSIDPEGSVSVIDFADKLDEGKVTMVKFDDESIIEASVRKAKPDATYAESLEPEYITIDEDASKAYVSCQESNAIAVLDLESLAFEKVYDLGVKDYSVPGNEIDASNKDDAINFQRYPVLSYYQPDGIDSAKIGSSTYIFTANEGDSQDYDVYSEEARVGDLADSIQLDAGYYAGYTQSELNQLVAAGLFNEENLGRLKVTTANGKNSDGIYTALYGYGGRSFSIYSAETMEQVYDSGNDFGVITAKTSPKYFNTTNDENAFDDRSDDKGIEPEGIIVGSVGNNYYAFIGLERFGGIMVYDVTNVENPEFELYTTTRVFGDEAGGDLAPEGLCFVSAEDSPTGHALLLAAHEVSGTIVIFEIQERTETLITLLHTNDMHGRVKPGKYDGMGIARVASIKDEFLKANPNTLLVDAGDAVHGTTFATLDKGASVIEIMNKAGYDIMTPGNHDFNYGQDRFLELVEMADFDVIDSNTTVNTDGSNFLTPYIIKDMDGIKIAFFGLNTPETYYKTHPDNVEGLTFNDPVKIAHEMVNELDDQSDVIVCVAHLGIDDSTKYEYRSTAVAEQVDGIDLIVDGHSHTTLANGMMIKDTLIVSAGEYNKSVGVVNLVVGKDGVKELNARLISKASAPVIKEKNSVNELIADISDSQNIILSEVVGNSSVLLDGERAHVRTQETNLGNLITDAMVAETGADIALTNGGGIRASIDAGPITKGEVITVLPFGNYVETREMTGQTIKDALENGVSDYPAAKGAFLQVSGLTFEIDPSKSVGQRAEKVKVNGKALDLNKSYVVATNNFLGAGGDGYKMFTEAPILNEYSALDEVLIDYIVSLGSASPKIESRIVVAESTSSQSTSSQDTCSGQSACNQGTDDGKTTVYIVKAGDVLWRIAEKYGLTWQELNAMNDLDNPQLIHAGQKLIVPAQ